MISPSPVWFASLAICFSLAPAEAQTGAGANRLTYLDGSDPFYAGLNLPRLTTPQWAGEPGVEAAVILAIDDLREPEKYETFLRPILDRLRQIDGRAPVSIFCNQLDARNPQLLLERIPWECLV